MIHHSKMLDHIKWLNIDTVTDGKKIEYFNIPSAFDIETTSIKDSNGNKSAFMYIWQFGIGDGEPVFYGRTWNEFVNLLDDISEYYELSTSKRLVIYVHNLGYEFQFMRKWFTWNNVFSVSERSPVRALTDNGIEFRCSYLLSGYSLASLAKNLVTHKLKKSGDLDYNLTRHHDTPLTDDEMNYCKLDIDIVTAYIDEQIALCGDIANIPMTNTGRVRKFVRDRCYNRNSDGTKAGYSKRQKYSKIMGDLTLTPDVYAMLLTAFRGGFTHANANHVNKVLTDVTSIDFTSSYPSVMLSERYPMSRFRPIEIDSETDLVELCNKYALLIDISFVNLRPKITQENYISESKCTNVKNPIINNGRIVSCDYLSTHIIDTDFKIISACYEWDYIEVGKVLYAHKAYLPKDIIRAILDLYQDKTKLKGVIGQEVEYLLSKGMLNSVYGMSVTAVVQDNATYTDDHNWQVEPADIIEGVEKYNKSRNRFLFYAWGVWVTGYARLNLWTGILATGDDYVYSDTDSLKLLNYEKYKPYIDEFNADIVAKMKAMCKDLKLDPKLLEPETNDGVKKMIGIWDYEGTYTRFKTLGAKRYIVEHHNEITITVAGLGKQNGVNYMLDVCNNDNTKVFDMFNDNLYIPALNTGKMTHSYIDEPETIIVTDHLNKQREVTSLSGIHLEPCEYTLSLSATFNTFLNNLSNGYIFNGVKKL